MHISAAFGGLSASSSCSEAAHRQPANTREQLLSSRFNLMLQRCAVHASALPCATQVRRSPAAPAVSLRCSLLGPPSPRLTASGQRRWSGLPWPSPDVTCSPDGPERHRLRERLGFRVEAWRSPRAAVYGVAESDTTARLLFLPLFAQEFRKAFCLRLFTPSASQRERQIPKLVRCVFIILFSLISGCSGPSLLRRSFPGCG